MTICEIKLKFPNSPEPVVLKDKETIKKIPVILRAINIHNIDCETTDTIVKDPIEIPFPFETGQFFFDNILKYKRPAEPLKTKVTEYKEASEKSIEQLKEYMEIAEFMECDDFMRSIAFVLAKKFDKKTDAQIVPHFPASSV
ncbi:hypothetical protein CRE_14956 [Caenorhabditis remanei]|uniref:SKP1 component POZ domain-containing protein n=1 Tax=Caenorhabditis remanei TaxID=31234 RepID=E3NBX2_CAERE|nr:hypothetical protein CRE_14956 [Caenorhabditis remanei]